MISISPLPQLSATKIRTGLTSFETLVDCLIKQYEQQASSGNVRPRRDPRWRTQRAVVAKASRPTARVGGSSTTRQKSTAAAVAPKNGQSPAIQRPLRKVAAPAQTPTTAIELPLFGRMRPVSCGENLGGNVVNGAAKHNKPAHSSDSIEVTQDSATSGPGNNQVVQITHCAMKPTAQRISPAKVRNTPAQQALFQWYADETKSGDSMR